MKIKDFFNFRSKLVSSTFQAGPVGLKKDHNGIDEEDNLIKGNYNKINFPVVFKQDCGKTLTDVLDTGWASLFLISDRMKTILETHEIKGWKTFHIKLYDKKENEVFGYHGFSIVGRCGPIDDRKAEIIEKQSIPTGPIYKAYRGLYVGLDKWDGMDLFIPEESLFLIVTKKLADILKKNKISNMRLRNLSDIEIAVDAVLKKN